MRDYYLVFTLWDTGIAQTQLKTREILFSTTKSDLPLDEVKERILNHLQGDNNRLIGVTGAVMISEEEAERHRLDIDEDNYFV